MARNGRGPYRGNDRRRGGGAAPLGEAYALGAVLLLATVIAVGLVAASVPDMAPARTAGLSDLFETLGGAFAVGAFLLCLLRWRLSGEAASLWVGAAVLVFGVVVIGVAQLGLPLLADADELRAVLPATYAAGVLGTMALLALALIAPEVDARRRAWRVAVGALALVGLAAVILSQATPVYDALTSPRAALVRPGFRATARTVLSVPIALLGLSSVVLGVLRHRTVVAWSGLTGCAIGLAELAAARQVAPTDLWLPGGYLLRATGFLLLMIGCSRDLRRSYVDQQGRLFDSQIAIRVGEARQRLQRAGNRQRTHDLRGSLMAIEGAALTLQRHNEALSDDARGQLMSMLAAEISRLQGLVIEPAQEMAPFTLADAVRAAVDGRGDGAVVIEVKMRTSPAVIGSPADTTEIICGLLEAAISETSQVEPGLTIEVGDEPGWGVVRVCFRAASFPHHERRAVLTRHLAGPVDDGATDGLGLQVAGQLVRDQGGQLTLGASEAGRLCFELRLPAEATGA